MKIRLALALLLGAAGTARADDITFAAVGDVMLGSTFPDESGGMLAPDDGAHLLEEVTPILSVADVTFGNLEGPMIDGGVSAKCGPAPSAAPPKKGKKKRKSAEPKSCYAFRVPTRYGKYLKDAGFDIMGLANNHALDFGPEGRESSTRVLDELGILHSGAVGDIAHMTVKGKKLALIAFATYPHSYNLNELDKARELVAGEAKANDLVIVSYHGGAEGATRQHVPAGAEMFYNENRGDLRTFTHAMIDAGAAMVFGHGPHVVRGMEIYKGHLIAYSLGNFATYGGMNLQGAPGISLILDVQLGDGGVFKGGKAHPVVQIHPGGPHLDPEGKVIPILRALSHDDFGDAAPSFADDGTISAPAS